MPVTELIRPDTSVETSSFWVTALRKQREATRQDEPVTFDYGPARCTVDKRSKIVALNEAFRSAVDGLGPTTFGPTITPATHAETLANTSLRAAVKSGEAKDHGSRVRVFNEIQAQAGIKLKEGDTRQWSEAVKNPAKQNTVALAWRIACLVQARIDSGARLRRCWKNAVADANLENFNVGVQKEAITLLQRVWHYGSQLQALAT